MVETTNDATASDTNKNMELILKRLTTIETVLQTIVSLQENMATLQKNVDGVVSSQTLINIEFEKQKKTIHNLETKNITLENEVCYLKQSEVMKAEVLLKVESDLNDLEQYGRRNMIEIRGVPRSPTEDTDQIVMQIAGLTNTEVNKEDIEVSHRTSSSENAAIIVKFLSRRKREELFSNRKLLVEKTTRHIGFEESSKIFINESLTQFNGGLMKDAREKLKKNKLVEYLWSKNGKIFVKQNNKTASIQIKSKKDISKIILELDK